MPKISVIVPVYNAEKYLRRCLDSIKQQTFTDFECLLIDDGSTDLSGKICAEYAESDSRFIVFHKENGGVSSARNIGIGKAMGDYISFIDADDYVNTTYLQNLYSKDYDFVISGIILRSNKDKIIYPPNINTSNIVDTSSFVQSINKVSYILNGPCQKMFKRSILVSKNIRFPLNLSYGEDTIFVLDYLGYVKTAYSVSVADYVYEQKVENSLSKKVSFEIRFDYVKMMLSLYKSKIEEKFNATFYFNISNLLIDQIITTFGLIYTKSYRPKNERIELVSDFSKILNSEHVWLNLSTSRLFMKPILLHIKLGKSCFFDFLSLLCFKLKVYKNIFLK